MYFESYGLPWRDVQPLPLAVCVVSAFLSGWVIWGYGFHWAFGAVWRTLFEPHL